MKNCKIILIAVACLLSGGTKAYSSRPAEKSEYTAHEYKDNDGHRIKYRMLEPENVTNDKKYPLVLFLHGSGERGTDNIRQLANGGSIFTNPVNLDRYPAYVVFPQCQERSWTEMDRPSNFMPGAPMPKESSSIETLVALTKDLVSQYSIDKDRIYVIGISMGGIAVYDLVCRYPDIFAAAVPICGAVNPDRLKDAKDVNFFIFHGSDDEEIPVITSRIAYKTLHEEGANVDYVEFAGIGHTCWTEAFNYPDLLPWLFSQTRHTEASGYTAEERW